MATITTDPNAPAPEPAGSPRRVCLDKGWNWDAETQSCTPPDKREEAAPDQAPKGSDVFVTTAEGKRVIQTPETLKADRDAAEIQTARAEAIASGQLSASQAQAAKLTEIELAAQLLQEPVVRQLDPTRTILEEVPVVGPLLDQVANYLRDVLPGLESERFELTPEQLRTAALTEIERIEIEKGLTASEKVGSFIESVPAANFATWIPGFAEAEVPSGNVQTIVKGLRLLKTRARDVISNAETGDLTRSQANERLDVIEAEIQEDESRMKLLIQNSPALKFNSDGVNFIEDKILETRILIQDGRLAAIKGQVSDSQMTDAVIVNKLESFDDEDFTIPGL